jgi:hypothetical protein
MNTVRLFVTVLILATGSAGAKERPWHYTYRPVSIAFVPGFSTNGPTSPYISSSVSLNVIGGYLGQVHGVELGGVFNLEEDEVVGYQAAGVFNITGGRFIGLQQAGVFSIVGGRFAGVQQAGVINIVDDGFSGLEMAGVVNVVGGSFVGAQMAGVVNVAVQQMSGLQLSGVVNAADEFSGAQIGLVNIAGRGRGLQLGLVNIADDMDVPIGLVSIVRNGQFHVNVWASEFSLVNVGIKTGSKAIYNVFMLGYQPGGDTTRLLAGLGIGGHIPLKRFFVDIDLLSHGVFTGPDWFPEGGSDLLSSLRVTGGWQLADGLALTAGPTISVWVSDREDGSTVPFYDAPLFRWHGSENVRIWPGFTIGLQLL